MTVHAVEASARASASSTASTVGSVGADPAEAGGPHADGSSPHESVRRAGRRADAVPPRSREHARRSSVPSPARRRSTSAAVAVPAPPSSWRSLLVVCFVELEGTDRRLHAASPEPAIASDETRGAFAPSRSDDVRARRRRPWPRRATTRPSFVKMFWRCRPTVCSLMTSADATSRFVTPVATSRRTSHSRSVRSDAPAGSEASRSCATRATSGAAPSRSKTPVAACELQRGGVLVAQSPAGERDLDTRSGGVVRHLQLAPRQGSERGARRAPPAGSPAARSTEPVAYEAIARGSGPSVVAAGRRQLVGGRTRGVDIARGEQDLHVRRQHLRDTRAARGSPRPCAGRWRRPRRPGPARDAAAPFRAPVPDPARSRRGTRAPPHRARRGAGAAHPARRARDRARDAPAPTGVGTRARPRPPPPSSRHGPAGSARGGRGTGPGTARGRAAPHTTGRAPRSTRRRGEGPRPPCTRPRRRSTRCPLGIGDTSPEVATTIASSSSFMPRAVVAPRQRRLTAADQRERQQAVVVGSAAPRTKISSASALAVTASPPSERVEEIRQQQQVRALRLRRSCSSTSRVARANQPLAGAISPRSRSTIPSHAAQRAAPSWSPTRAHSRCARSQARSLASSRPTRYAATARTLEIVGVERLVTREDRVRRTPLLAGERLPCTLSRVGHGTQSRIPRRPSAAGSRSGAAGVVTLHRSRRRRRFRDLAPHRDHPLRRAGVAGQEEHRHPPTGHVGRVRPGSRAPSRGRGRRDRGCRCADPTPPFRSRRSG